jgi:hypothetical protein
VPRAFPSTRRPKELTTLPAQAQPLNELLVAGPILASKVRQQSSTAADELEQPPATMMIMRMRTQMVDELVDALRQQRDLDIGGTCVRAVNLVIADQLRALLFLQVPLHNNRAGAWAGPAFIR